MKDMLSKGHFIFVILNLSLLTIGSCEEGAGARKEYENLDGPPWSPNYCNDTQLQVKVGLKKTALGQYLGYACDNAYYHCRWGSRKWSTLRMECRAGLIYDTETTQQCNYPFEVPGCKQKAPCSDCFVEDFACCYSDQCIDLGQRCDRKLDCILEEDEKNCPICGKMQFPCVKSNKCIYLQQRCNDVQDCEGGEDERYCRECGQGNFFCINTRKCIPAELRCNNANDCSLGEDENYCDAANMEEFMCGGEPEVWIPASRVCDGKMDCENESDEQNCNDSLKHVEVHRGRKTIPSLMGWEIEEYDREFYVDQV